MIACVLAQRCPSHEVQYMLRYFLAFLFLKEVTGVLDDNLRLVFGRGYERAEELVTAACNRVFIGEHDQGRLVPLRQDLPGMPHFSGSGVIRADGDEERPHRSPGFVSNVGKRRFVGGNDFFGNLLRVSHAAEYGLPDLHVGMGLGIPAPGQKSFAGLALTSGQAGILMITSLANRSGI